MRDVLQGGGVITQITYHSLIYNQARTVKAVQRGLLAINPAEYETTWCSAITNETVGTSTYQSGWNVTHIPTGACICHTRSIWKARRALRALEKLGDWDFTAPVAGEGLDLSGVEKTFIKKARKVAKRFHESDN
jgi:hypothetical protein